MSLRQCKNIDFSKLHNIKPNKFRFLIIVSRKLDTHKFEVVKRN